MPMEGLGSVISRLLQRFYYTGHFNGKTCIKPTDNTEFDCTVYLRIYIHSVDNTISRTGPNVMPGSHLRRFVIFVASSLVILSHSVCDFGSVISVYFFM